MSSAVDRVREWLEAKEGATLDAADLRALLEERDRLAEGHCRDCCCSRSWEALGIAKMDGSSIPEHIARLKERIARVEDYLIFTGLWRSVHLQKGCIVCGYNGQGYFQPDKHPCAGREHELHGKYGFVDELLEDRTALGGE